MNQSEDLYEILQVSSSAEQDVIEAAYRRLARRYHPDVNKSPGAHETMVRLNRAYETLSDPNSRADYDQSRHLDESPHLDEDPEWLEDIEYPMQVTLEEACFGTTRFLDLPGGRRVEVKIPPGVDNGSRVQVSVGRARQESIHLVISVQPHPNFQRQGRDIYYRVNLDPENASLGGEVIVPTISGRVALVIPPETANGRRFRLAGQGMSALNNPGLRGDLYVTVKVNQGRVTTGPQSSQPPQESHRRKRPRRRPRGTRSQPPLAMRGSDDGHPGQHPAWVDDRWLGTYFEKGRPLVDQLKDQGRVGRLPDAIKRGLCIYIHCLFWMGLLQAELYRTWGEESIGKRLFGQKLSQTKRFQITQELARYVIFETANQICEDVPIANQREGAEDESFTVFYWLEVSCRILVDGAFQEYDQVENPVEHVARQIGQIVHRGYSQNH